MLRIRIDPNPESFLRIRLFFKYQGSDRTLIGMDSDLRNYRDPMDLDPKHCPLGFELDMVRLCPLALLKLLMSFNEKIFFFPNSFCSQGPVLRPGIFYFMDNIWQDAGIRTQVAATAARCATNELHT